MRDLNDQGTPDSLAQADTAQTVGPTDEVQFHFQSAGLTDVGCQRTTNEDAMLIDEAQGVFLVCDGMGGHASGQVASELAVSAVAESIRTGSPPSAAGEDSLVTALKYANQRVFERGQSDPACHGMGTTAVGVRVEGDLLHVCHCGDSRLYMLRQGQLVQITRDHSLVNLYKDKPELQGQMGPASSNVIVRAIGLDINVEIDHRVVALEDGDLFLLCCDGLTDLVDDWMIREIITSGEPLEVVSENLVRTANSNGGTDNITVVLLSVASDEAARITPDAAPTLVPGGEVTAPRPTAHARAQGTPTSPPAGLSPPPLPVAPRPNGSRPGATNGHARTAPVDVPQVIASENTEELEELEALDAEYPGTRPGF